MEFFSPNNIQYLYDLAITFDQVVISGSFMLDLLINGSERAFEEDRVVVLYDGASIAEYPMTPEGVAQGLSMLRLADRKTPDDLRQMIRDLNIKKFGEQYYR